MNLKELENKAKWLRQEIFELVVKKKKGHIPSCFSLVEILVSLYYGGILDEKRGDRVIISKGHAAMALYPILVDKGIVDAKELDKFTDKDGLFRLYADPSIPGIPCVTGSLGHGIGVACGLALADRDNGGKARYFVITGDAEMQEGSCYESIIWLDSQRLNVTVIVDNNGLGILEKTNFQAPGFEVVQGHDIEEIIRWSYLKYINAITIKGKGISFMQGNPKWHNRMMNELEINRAREELYE